MQQAEMVYMKDSTGYQTNLKIQNEVVNQLSCNKYCMGNTFNRDNPGALD